MRLPHQLQMGALSPSAPQPYEYSQQQHFSPSTPQYSLPPSPDLSALNPPDPHPSHFSRSAPHLISPSTPQPFDPSDPSASQPLSPSVPDYGDYSAPQHFDPSASEPYSTYDPRSLGYSASQPLSAPIPQLLPDSLPPAPQYFNPSAPQHFSPPAPQHFSPPAPMPLNYSPPSPHYSPYQHVSPSAPHHQALTHSTPQPLMHSTPQPLNSSTPHLLSPHHPYSPQPPSHRSSTPQHLSASPPRPPPVPRAFDPSAPQPLNPPVPQFINPQFRHSDHQHFSSSTPQLSPRTARVPSGGPHTPSQGWAVTSASPQMSFSARQRPVPQPLSPPTPQLLDPSVPQALSPSAMEPTVFIIRPKVPQTADPSVPQAYGPPPEAPQLLWPSAAQPFDQSAPQPFDSSIPQFQEPSFRAVPQPVNPSAAQPLNLVPQASRLELGPPTPQPLDPSAYQQSNFATSQPLNPSAPQPPSIPPSPQLSPSASQPFDPVAQGLHNSSAPQQLSPLTPSASQPRISPRVLNLLPVVPTIHSATQSNGRSSPEAHAPSPTASRSLQAPPAQALSPSVSQPLNLSAPLEPGLSATQNRLSTLNLSQSLSPLGPQPQASSESLLLWQSGHLSPADRMDSTTGMLDVPESVSFEGCGAAICFHLGVYESMIQLYGLSQLRGAHPKFIGTSSGAIAALIAALCLDPREWTDRLKDIWTPIYADTSCCGLCQVDKYVEHAIDQMLSSVGPHAYQLLNDKLFVSVTKFFHRNTLVSQWNDNDHVKRVVMTSCFIPVVMLRPHRMGTCFAIDGGFSGNQNRLTEGTILCSATRSPGSEIAPPVKARFRDVLGTDMQNRFPELFVEGLNSGLAYFDPRHKQHDRSRVANPTGQTLAGQIYFNCMQLTACVFIRETFFWIVLFLQVLCLPFCGVFPCNKEYQTSVPAVERQATGVRSSPRRKQELASPFARMSGAQSLATRPANQPALNPSAPQPLSPSAPQHGHPSPSHVPTASEAMAPSSLALDHSALSTAAPGLHQGSSPSTSQPLGSSASQPFSLSDPESLSHSVTHPVGPSASTLGASQQSAPQPLDTFVPQPLAPPVLGSDFAASQPLSPSTSLPQAPLSPSAPQPGNFSAPQPLSPADPPAIHAPASQPLDPSTPQLQEHSAPQSLGPALPSLQSFDSSALEPLSPNELGQMGLTTQHPPLNTGTEHPLPTITTSLDHSALQPPQPRSPPAARPLILSDAQPLSTLHISSPPAPED